MDRFLVFTLSAGIASMGSNAGNEFRGTLGWPGRSAILGLIAAARGIDRLNAEGQEIVASHRVAVGIHDMGASFTDFHTIQSVPRAAVKRPATRGDALALAQAKGATETTLTRRDYRTDVLYSVALWDGDIEVAHDALLKPAFHLYLGRKSCPLNAPPAPRLIEAADPGAALRAAVLPYWKPDPLLSIASDPHPALQGRQITRNDDPTCRKRWEFRNRTVTVLDVAQET
jgi:CRISPR system Cascade subunit CasD